MTGQPPFNEHTETSEVIFRPESRAVWHFWLVAGMFCLSELAALLYGARLIPHFSGSLMWTTMPALAAGWAIEQWLLQITGAWVVSEQRPMGPYDRAFSRGTVYVLPPVLASVGRVLGWWPIFASLLLFVGLIARILVLWSRRQFAD